MTMTLTYKALSALLAYPTADLVAALPEIRALVEREPKLPRARKDALHAPITSDEGATIFLRGASPHPAAVV